jgi:hypothetical protein
MVDHDDAGQVPLLSGRASATAAALEAEVIRERASSAEGEVIRRVDVARLS